MAKRKEAIVSAARTQKKVQGRNKSALVKTVKRPINSQQELPHVRVNKKSVADTFKNIDNHTDRYIWAKKILRNLWRLWKQ